MVDKTKTPSERAAGRRARGSNGIVLQRDEMIVKVQRPLLSTKDAPALLYDERREHLEQRALTPEEYKLMGKEYRVFFVGTWSHKAKTWTLKTKLPWQPW